MEAAQSLPNILPVGEPPLPVWTLNPLDLAHCSSGFALPTRALRGIELWSFRLSCAPPVYRVLIEFKLFPFSFFPFLFSPLWLFPLFHFLSSCFQQRGPGECGVAFPIPLTHFLSPQAKTAPRAASLSPSSPLHAMYLPSSVVQVMQIVVLILKLVF